MSNPNTTSKPTASTEPKDEAPKRTLLSDLKVHEPAPEAPKPAPKPGDIAACKVKHGTLVAGDGQYKKGAECALPYFEAVKLAEQGIVEIL